jgi:hypothetical protein
MNGYEYQECGYALVLWCINIEELIAVFVTFKFTDF